MLNVKISTIKLSFEAGFEDRSLNCYLAYNHKVLINYEKHFPKKFKCASCKESCEEDGSMKLCDSCLADYMENWRKQLK